MVTGPPSVCNRKVKTLSGGTSTVDAQGGAVHERRVIASQVEDGRRDLGRLRRPAGRGLAGQ
jgi:hypothetical protein